MINNTKNGYDDDVYKTSLGKAIRTVAHPFETFQDKIECVTKKYNNHSGPETQEQKIEAFKGFFKDYYESPDIYNYYDLTIVEPWVK